MYGRDKYVSLGKSAMFDADSLLHIITLCTVTYTMYHQCFVPYLYLYPSSGKI